jgi:hypothetical protein
MRDYPVVTKDQEGRALYLRSQASQFAVDQKWRERMTRVLPCNRPGRCVGEQANALSLSKRGKSPLLQVDGLIMPDLVELGTPHLVHTLVLGSAERHGRPEPNVEVVQALESSY